jgi:hypothetical protein
VFLCFGKRADFSNATPAPQKAGLFRLHMDNENERADYHFRLFLVSGIGSRLPASPF